ncbi:PP2C family protein-serine/threonine phosphatase [Pseudoroseomonas cervicalis]|uniref:Stage II sporulation protein E n=1 Tax=Pseudoroseomonas cervicalis ATCC 49957 TaxID=525371 RepID=D5RSM7_9PROT|nr:SpoIIE family protein phosphatase [Pseudoroseomonas cervicalis]EFH09689.1 stage II sporulation protein E [Pseudoroseomonas cervicalis ATCC 49957]
MSDLPAAEAAANADVALLVVDDSSFNRLMLKRRLGELGYSNITMAEDGEQGLAAIERQRFDVVLLDLEMPRLDGISVLEQLHAARGAAPPVIVISALTEMAKIVRCIELGAEDYLPKSFDLPLLRARLGAVLEKKRLRDLADQRLALLEAELESARAAQLSLVPRDFAAIAPGGLDLCAAMVPARQVGGDLYDAFRIAPGLLLITVADVAGKGAPAGLTMARSLGLIRAAATLLSAGGERPDPAAIIAHANDDLARDNESQTFVTIALAVIDAGTGEGRICVAGHEAPYRLSAGGVAPLTGLTRQPPMGAMEGYPYGSDPLALAPGEGLLLFSDGVTEAEDAQEEFFGRERLEAALAPQAGAAPVAVVEAVLRAVEGFVAGAPQADDITVLVLRRG